MAAFRPFLHVERLDEAKVNVADFLNGTVYCFPKLDGTNAVAWADQTGQIHCGSRKRELSEDKDNANFMVWFTTDASTEALRDFLVENPNLIIYGEWLNGVDGNKQTGAIKQYLNPGFWIFAVFDTNTEQYIPYDVYSKFFENVYDKVDRPIIIYTKPTKNDIVNLLADNHFNLPHDIDGEGVVCWNYDYYDKWGVFKVTKIVAKEFLEKKGAKRKERSNKQKDLEGLEREIVNSFISSADCEKCKQKIMTFENLDEWPNDGKHVSMFINMLYTDLVNEEMLSIIRRFKNPKIDFKVLKEECFTKGRKFLGLA